jgi:hypothetical protein
VPNITVQKHDFQGAQLITFPGDHGTPLKLKTLEITACRV